MSIYKKTDIDDPSFSFLNKIKRSMWFFCWIVFFRFSPIPLFKWRVLLLRLFGSDIDISARVYPSVKIWCPANLIIGKKSTIGPYSHIYNQGRITLEDRVILSQGSYLCASTHDYNDPIHPLILAPIIVKDNVWVCADAFIGPNVVLGQGSVIGARAVVTKNTEDWFVYAGNPAQKLKARKRFVND
ncbi:hypothetical protein ACMXYX_03370 [Neptuniibacter sp. QD72_48]|uniref:hypothetical protein n=1 Tax=Neptuniibacter sp. QD72_48 TaxID=3398214 RepID=UPI0039F454C8